MEDWKYSNCLILQATSVTNHCKSWIAFQTHALESASIRQLVRSGLKPSFEDIHGLAMYNPHFYDADKGDLTSDTLCDEWNELIRYWYKEVFDSDILKLVYPFGDSCTSCEIQLKRKQSLRGLEEHLIGVLEPIIDPDLQDILAHQHKYPYLHSYVSSEGEDIHAILFGPLTLVKKNQNSSLCLTENNSQFAPQYVRFELWRICTYFIIPTANSGVEGDGEDGDQQTIAQQATSSLKLYCLNATYSSRLDVSEEYNASIEEGPTTRTREFPFVVLVDKFRGDSESVVIVGDNQTINTASYV